MNGRTAVSHGARFFSRLGADGSIAAVAIVALLGCILVPLPTALLDVLLVLNMVLALVVLLRGLSVHDPVKLYSFPAILLFSTLFRLALNVSSTRLILTQGEQGTQAAGEVIRSFGEFVVRGDFFVGAILFAVIAVVNFVVIAKGSARVAEVAARFVLDALPGKQLAIDADLRAGSISREEAERRRAHLVQESQFFGAMDGAMKFVQGDAVAGMAIVAINALGGISLGKSRGMEILDAVNTFGLLTIGEGLVNILPSLLMSLAAGIIVTHVSGPRPGGTGSAVVSQLFGDSRVLMLSAGALLFFGLLPGLPLVPFLLVASALAVIARFVAVGPDAGGWVEVITGEPVTGAPPVTALPAGSSVLLPWHGAPAGDPASRIGFEGEQEDEVEALTLEVDGRVLGPYLQRLEQRGADQSFATLFEQRSEPLCRERGIPQPRLRVRVEPLLDRGRYRVMVREQVVRQGALDESALLVSAGPSLVVLFGATALQPGRHPLDGRGATWCRVEGEREASPTLAGLRRLGVEVLTPADVLVAEVLGSLLQLAEEVVGLEETKQAILKLRERSSHLVEEIFDRGVISYAEMSELLRRLVRERIPIRDTKRVVELVAEFSALHPPSDDRPAWLSDAHAFIRLVLVRSLLRSTSLVSGKLRVFLLSTDVEEEFRTAQIDWEYVRSRLPLEPQIESALRENAKRMFQPVIDRGNVPVYVLCAGDIRVAVQEFFQRALGSSDWLRTLSYHELDASVVPESVGILGV